MLKLYHLQASPYGWMARAALAEKGLEYESVDEKTPELKTLNPLNRTPTLVEDGRTVYESWAVLEYLDEKHPTPPLMPKDPADRARARTMAMLGYLYIFQDNRIAVMQLFDWDKWEKPMPYPSRKPADQVDKSILGPAEERLMGHYRILDTELGSRPWATGDGFGNADIVLATAAAGYRLRGGPITEFPRVVKWLDACLARPSMKDHATPLVKAGKPV